MQPNIVLFLTDDHAPWTLPEYGHTELATPSLSRLAREGVRFANAFTPSPVCSPARACLMTGRTPSQVGIHDWLEERDPEIAARGWLDGQFTLPHCLRQAGYHTILSGKWHLGGSHRTPPGFTRGFGLPGHQGAHNERYTYHQDGQPIELEGNKSAIITERALAMLDESPAGQPFFLNIGYIATHSPYDAAVHDPELVAEVEALEFRDLPPYRPHPWVKNEGAGSELSPEQLRKLYLGYHAAVLELDRNVGRVLAHLEARGQLENTLVVYVSDHGCALGHHGFFGKGNSTRPLNMYETSLRVPLLMRGPGLARGAVVEQPVDHYDLFQALYEWGGCNAIPAEQRAGYPGRDLLPLAEARVVPDWPQERFGEYGDLRMIRNAQFKLVRRYPDGPDELFDLVQNPGESVNLAGTAAHADTQRELQRRLEAWYSRHETHEASGLRVKALPGHNRTSEAWRDGLREARGLQIYQGDYACETP